jgi:hypothetical protein
MPKKVADLLLACTKDSTSVLFATRHYCKKHSAVINMDHLECCDLFSGTGKIKAYAAKIKKQKLQQWSHQE